MKNLELVLYFESVIFIRRSDRVVKSKSIKNFLVCRNE